MPKATYEDFINSYSALKGLEANPDAQAIFDILNHDASIYGAIQAIEKHKPALSANVQTIDVYAETHQDSQFPLTDFNKQAIGRMQKVILDPFGYEPNGKQKSLKSPNFGTASCYEYKDGKASMEIRVTVKSVEVSKTGQNNVKAE